MKRSRKSFYGGVVLVAVLACGQLYAESPTVETANSSQEASLKNPGFEECVQEEVKSQTVFGWQLNKACPSVVELVDDKEKAHSGAKCILIKPQAADKEGHLYQVLPVVAGKKYALKFWAKADAEAKVKAVVYQYQKKAFAGSVSSNDVPVSGKWAEIAYNYTPPEGVAEIAFVIAVTDRPTHVDDASFGEFQP